MNERIPLPARCADSFAGEHPGFEVLWNRGPVEGWFWCRPDSVNLMIGPFNSSGEACQNARKHVEAPVTDKQYHHPDFL